MHDKYETPNIKKVMGIFYFFDDCKIHDLARSRFLARSHEISKIWGPMFVALEILNHMEKKWWESGIIEDARTILVFFNLAAIVRPSWITIFPKSKNVVCGTNIKEI